MALRLPAIFLSAVALILPLDPLLGSVPARAATVTGQGGTVLVSRGEQGFVPLASAAELAAGGRVFVQPGGSATIVYASGCSVRVGSGFWVVQEQAPCAPGTTEIDLTARMN